MRTRHKQRQSTKNQNGPDVRGIYVYNQLQTIENFDEWKEKEELHDIPTKIEAPVTTRFE